MGSGTQDLKLDWPNPEALVDFIDELRQAGYNIGVSQYIAANDLILALAAEEEFLDHPARLRSLLGPVLCGTPEEQDDFVERYNRWMKRFKVVTPGVVELDPQKQDFADELDAIERQTHLWLWGLYGLYFGTLLVMLGSLAYVLRHRAVGLAWAWDAAEIRRLIAIGGPILLAGAVTSLFRSLDKLMILGYMSQREYQ